MATPMIPPAGAADFLARAGWAAAAIEPLAGDASFRRYFRVRAEARTAVLMDAPPPHEDVRPFLAIAGELRARGLAAPGVLAADEVAGLLLIEDFGDARLTSVLAREPGRERELYTLAADVLVELSRRAPPAGLRAFDWAEYRRELGMFDEWYLPAHGIARDTGGYEAAWRTVFERDAPAADTLALRDYHADNLMLRDGRGGLSAMGLLDFQDARAGHRAYDLVSLLQDARRDVAPAIEAAMIDRYVEQVGIEPEQFRADYERLGAQRNTKILGVFARLWKRDGKPAYLALMPRVWGHLERNLAHPALEPVRGWFDANVPASARAAAWSQAA